MFWEDRLTPRFFMAVALAMLPVAALAQSTPRQVETVEVDGNALIGVWKIDWPNYGHVDLSFHATWGPMQGNFCRIEKVEDGLSANCFPNPGRDGSVTVEKSHFHMAWGSMMARIYVDGGMSSPLAFEGHMGAKLSGLAIENPTPSHGEKLDLSAITSDGGGKATLLAQLLAGLAKGDASVLPNLPLFRPPGSAELRPLGAIESVIYLGLSPNPVPPTAKEPAELDFYRVYDVEFANGHRICGLHQRPDDVVDALRCV